MMHMTFWIGYNIKDFIFRNLNISSATGLFVACICAFGIAVFYESLKVSLAAVKLNLAILKVPNRQRCFTDDMVLIDNGPHDTSRRYFWTFIEGLLYTVELLFGYVVMLLVMTYNVYILVALIFATGFCYFLFGHRLMGIKMKTSKLKIPCEHCSKHQKDSNTSSTEVITESVTDNIEPPCCINNSVTVHY